MSNIGDAYTGNPQSTLPLSAVIYLLLTSDVDAGINGNDLIAHIIGTQINGGQLVWNSATSITIKKNLLACENGDVIEAASDITLSGLSSLAASTFYHVYEYLSGSTPAGEVSTTAPAAWKRGAYSKTSDTSRRYMGSILTDGSGNIFEFVHYLPINLIEYKDVTITASPFRVLSSANATTVTAVDCSGAVPATSKMVSMIAWSGCDKNIYMSESSALSSTVRKWIFHANENDKIVGYHPLNSSQNFYYLTASGPTGGITADIMGYIFDR